MMLKRSSIRLIVLALGFLVWHAGPSYRAAPGMDEDLFAVTGTTIKRTGLPSLPFLPARDPRTCYEGADVVLYILPPLSFYAQALVQMILGDGIGPARMASTLEAIAATWLVWALAQRWFEDGRTSLFASAAFLFSRTVLFPATTVRPDMLATTFGLLAVWLVERRVRELRPRDAVFAGCAGGLSVLSHPMGVVPCAQVGLLLLARVKPPRRAAGFAAMFSIAALLMFALWLPLIALHPDLFAAQFRRAVLDRAGPGVLHTLIHPWPALQFQSGQFLERAGPIQTALGASAIIYCLVRSLTSATDRALVYHAFTSLIILILLMGQHPLLGYFAYPWAFASIAIGRLAGDCAARLGKFGIAMVTCALIALLLPGAGLRPLLAHARHWNDPNYDARVVAQRVLERIPPGALIAADGRYVLACHLAGRRVLHAEYLEFLPLPYEYVIVDPRERWRVRFVPDDLREVATVGDPSDPFAPAATIYRRPAVTPVLRSDANRFSVAGETEPDRNIEEHR